MKNPVKLGNFRFYSQLFMPIPDLSPWPIWDINITSLKQNHQFTIDRVPTTVKSDPFLTNNWTIKHNFAGCYATQIAFVQGCIEERRQEKRPRAAFTHFKKKFGEVFNNLYTRTTYKPIRKY